jgi:hypothetical protein
MKTATALPEKLYTPREGDLFEKGRRRIVLSLHRGAGFFYAYKWRRRLFSNSLWTDRSLMLSDVHAQNLPLDGWKLIGRDCGR